MRGINPDIYRENTWELFLFFVEFQFFKLLHIGVKYKFENLFLAFVNIITWPVPLIAQTVYSITEPQLVSLLCSVCCCCCSYIRMVLFIFRPRYSAFENGYSNNNSKTLEGNRYSQNYITYMPVMISGTVILWHQSIYDIWWLHS